MPDPSSPEVASEPHIVRTPPVDATTLKELGFSDLDAAGAAALLLRALAARVSERFPGEAARWPLISQVFQTRPYLAGQVVRLPVDEKGRPQERPVPFVFSTRTVLLAVDPLPGGFMSVADVFRWLPVGCVPPPDNPQAHEDLCTMANVVPGGALFVLSVEALKARDGAWIKDPAVVRQIEFNLARHRRLLGPDHEAVRKATVRPARVAEVLGIQQNALANGIERAGPGSKYARLAAGRTEGGFTFESVEMTAAEWGVGLQDAMERLERLRDLRKQVESGIADEATALLASANTDVLTKDACLKYLEKAGKAILKDGPRE